MDPRGHHHRRSRVSARSRDASAFRSRVRGDRAPRAETPKTTETERAPTYATRVGQGKRRPGVRADVGDGVRFGLRFRRFRPLFARKIGRCGDGERVARGLARAVRSPGFQRTRRAAQTDARLFRRAQAFLPVAARPGGETVPDIRRSAAGARRGKTRVAVAERGAVLSNGSRNAPPGRLVGGARLSARDARRGRRRARLRGGARTRRVGVRAVRRGRRAARVGAIRR